MTFTNLLSAKDHNEFRDWLKKNKSGHLKIKCPDLHDVTLLQESLKLSRQAPFAYISSLKCILF